MISRALEAWDYFWFPSGPPHALAVVRIALGLCSIIFCEDENFNTCLILQNGSLIGTLTFFLVGTNNIQEFTFITSFALISSFCRTRPACFMTFFANHHLLGVVHRIIDDFHVLIVFTKFVAGFILGV